MGDHLAQARKLTTDTKLLSLFDRLNRDLVAYNGFADQTRAAGQAGDVQRAVYLSTRGNLEPSNDIMPTLDDATETVRAVVTAELARLSQAQSTLRWVSVLSATADRPHDRLRWRWRPGFVVIRPLTALKTPW